MKKLYIVSLTLFLLTNIAFSTDNFSDQQKKALKKFSNPQEAFKAITTIKNLNVDAINASLKTLLGNVQLEIVKPGKTIISGGTTITGNFFDLQKRLISERDVEGLARLISQSAIEIAKIGKKILPIGVFNPENLLNNIQIVVSANMKAAYPQPKKDASIEARKAIQQIATEDIDLLKKLLADRVEFVKDAIKSEIGSKFTAVFGENVNNAILGEIVDVVKRGEARAIKPAETAETIKLAEPILGAIKKDFNIFNVDEVANLIINLDKIIKNQLKKAYKKGNLSEEERIKSQEIDNSSYIKMLYDGFIQKNKDQLDDYSKMRLQAALKDYIPAPQPIAIKSGEKPELLHKKIMARLKLEDNELRSLQKLGTDPLILRSRGQLFEFDPSVRLLKNATNIPEYINPKRPDVSGKIKSPFMRNIEVINKKGLIVDVID